MAADTLLAENRLHVARKIDRAAALIGRSGEDGDWGASATAAVVKTTPTKERPKKLIY